MPKGNIDERLAWGMKKSEMENQCSVRKINQKTEKWRGKNYGNTHL